MDGQGACVITIRLHWQVGAKNLNFISTSHRDARKVGKPAKAKSGSML
jgi:hypothetical protein